MQPSTIPPLRRTFGINLALGPEAIEAVLLAMPPGPQMVRSRSCLHTLDPRVSSIHILGALRKRLENSQKPYTIWSLGPKTHKMCVLKALGLGRVDGGGV